MGSFLRMLWRHRIPSMLTRKSTAKAAIFTAENHSNM